MQNALLITVISFAALLLAYRFYGRFLARRIFKLDPNRRTPAHEQEDGVDYVPTRVPVLFGHHFASIAGLGPILGPAIAVIWGWLPAVIWVVVGAIFMGAVHDLGALTVSLRFKGRSIGDVCRELVGPRARLLFLLIIFFAMSLAMGAFVNAISSLFVFFKPDAIIPSFGLILIAMGVGMAVYRFKVGLGPATLVALVAFGGLIAWGAYQPIVTYEWAADAETKQALNAAKDNTVTRISKGKTTRAEFASPYGATAAIKYHQITKQDETATKIEAAATTTTRSWVYVLLAYGFIAAVLPVWLLLQPRDYINSFQLYVALGCMLLGLTAATLIGGELGKFNHIDAPVFRSDVPLNPPEQEPKDSPSVSPTDPDKPKPSAPPWIPFLFVTIACGAISGFHSLVSSGTTVRQLNRETDALSIGYGAMLTEGALAILVIMACVAGLGGAAWTSTGAYGYWTGIKAGLGAQLNAVINGGANFLYSLGIGLAFGRTFLAVTIVSFALTTLDSATRLLRFNVEEIFKSASLKPLANRYVASLVAIGGIAAFALMPAGKSLWVMFGTTNQLLAGLTLLTVSLFLFKLGRPVWYTLIPMVLMLVVTVWAMIYSMIDFWSEDNWLLLVVSIIELGMSIWLLAEAGLSFARGRGGLEFADEAPSQDEDVSEGAAFSSAQAGSEAVTTKPKFQ